MGEKQIKISICAGMILLLIITSIGQSFTSNTASLSTIGVSSLLQSGSVDVWQDDFLNVSKIDMTFSDHIIVNTSLGTVSMENTYPAWTNPSFTRLKPIVITNSGQETFTTYVLDLTVAYAPDMQLDFDDLRFTNGAGVQLPYYILSKSNGVSCQVLVKIPSLPPGESTIYMFYGNPTATNQGSFPSIFTWQNRTRPDTMVSFKGASEGAWDPNVIYGQNRFLVTWEERIGPEVLSSPMPHYERTRPCVIHGRTYDKDGENPQPTNNSDIDISVPGSDAYHAENPCNAYGAGKFFVVWEENPSNQPLNRYEADIKGALVSPNGTVPMRFQICTATGGQYDPQVVYDQTSNRFLVVWADARYGVSDYDIWGRLYDSNGYAVNIEFPIAYDINYQGNPWIATDGTGNFLIVFEDGPSASLGPFSLYAYRYDWNGNRLGSRITIAVGSENVDYIYPAVSYNTMTQRYCVTWNDGDVSVDPSLRDSYNGNIWGKILSKTGGVMKNNFIIEAGTSFIRSCSIPYFKHMFFVAYDGTVVGTQDLYGRLLSSDGTVLTNRQMLSDGSSQNLDWNDVAVGADGIFVSWEDERDLLSLYADVFQYVWRSAQTIGSSNITLSIGGEEQLVTTAQLMSVPIQPEMFQEWRQFFAIGIIPSGCSFIYDIMDGNGTLVLKPNVQNGQNISDITASEVRLRATFTRSSAHHTPVLTKWNISALVGKDLYPPVTEITLDPAAPNGNNNWYVTPITVTFTVVDVDTDPENITTYYNINGFGVNIYNPAAPPVISSERANNYIEYWSHDSINEELPHHRMEGLNIDTIAPTITLYKPPYIISPGSVTINGSATEYTSGSGIYRVQIDVAEETVYDRLCTCEPHIWFEWNFSADLGENYDIDVYVWDEAGNKMQDRRTVQCPKHGIYESGCIYLFNNPKIGPFRLLVALGLSLAVNNDMLYVVLPEISSDAASVTFIATQSWLKQQFSFTDTDLSDGCSTDLLLPLGIYSIKAYAYDHEGTLIDEYTIITKMLILLL